MYANRVAHTLTPLAKAGRQARYASDSDARRTDSLEGAMRQAEFYAFVSVAMIVLTIVAVFVTIATLVE